MKSETTWYYVKLKNQNQKIFSHVIIFRYKKFYFIKIENYQNIYNPFSMGNSSYL